MRLREAMKTGATLVALGMISTLVAGPASAGFQRWTSTATNNPFSDGVDVRLLYRFSREGQMQLNCDSGKTGVILVVIPGFSSDGLTSGLELPLKVAVDGDIILDDLVGSVGSYGQNLAGLSVVLNKERADKITDAFVSAGRQIAVQTDLTSRPILLTARGSTAAARKLKTCYLAQKGAAEPVADEDAGKVERIAELRAEIDKLQAELKELEGS